MGNYRLDKEAIQQQISYLAATVENLNCILKRIEKESSRIYGQRGFGIASSYYALLQGKRECENQIYNINQTIEYMNVVIQITEETEKKAIRILNEQSEIDFYLNELAKGGKWIVDLYDYKSTISDLYEWVNVLFDISDKSDLEKIFSVLKGDDYKSPMIKRAESFKYFADGVVLIDAFIEQDTEKALKILNKYSEKELARVFESAGCGKFQSKAYAKLTLNAFETLGEDIGKYKDTYSGTAFMAQAAVDMTYGAFLKTGCEYAYEITDNTLEIFGADLDDTYENGIESFYEQFDELSSIVVDELLGEEGGDILREKLSVGNTVSEFTQLVKKIF